jgi:hypothetical protein
MLTTASIALLALAGWAQEVPGSVSLSAEDYAPFVEGNLPRDKIPIGINWQVHPRVGYGVLGLNMYSQLFGGKVEDAPYYPIAVKPPHSQALLSEYPSAKTFRTLYSTQQHIWPKYQTGFRKGEEVVPFPILHALEAGMEEDEEPGQELWGTKNAAFCFLETARSATPQSLQLLNLPRHTTD